MFQQKLENQHQLLFFELMKNPNETIYLRYLYIDQVFGGHYLRRFTPDDRVILYTPVQNYMVKILSKNQEVNLRKPGILVDNIRENIQDLMQQLQNRDVHLQKQSFAYHYY